MSSRKNSAEYIKDLIIDQYSSIVSNRVYILSTPAAFVTVASQEMPAIGIVYRGGTPDGSKPKPQYWKRDFDIYVYQSIWKPETAMVGGTGSTKGVLELCDDLENILNAVSDPANKIASIYVTGDIEPGQVPDFETSGFSAFSGLKILMTEET